MRTDNLRRISICQLSTFRWSFQEDIARYNTMGFESVGVWRRKVEDYGVDNSIDLLHNAKMRVSSLHWAGGFTGDGQSLAEGLQDAIDAIELAARMNAGCLIIHPGSRNGHTIPHATQLFSDSLAQLIPASIEYGVKLAIEPMLGREHSSWTFMTSFQESLALIRGLKDRIGLVLDLHNLGFQPELFESLGDFVDQIELVQLADRNSVLESERRPLGTGAIPLNRWLTKLQTLGYQGQFELEIHGSGVEDRDYFSMLEDTHAYFSSAPTQRMLSMQPSSQPLGPLASVNTRFDRHRD